MYPRSEPYATETLTMSDGQTVYVEQSGNPDGIPAVYLHGGPGGGLGKRGYTRRFDPERYRIIGLDQRGCGRSEPLAIDPRHDLAANTTGRLVADLEEIREHYGIESWLISGVSWGTTLGLAYAVEHPARVNGMVLMCVTTTNAGEVAWITEGVSLIFPEAWTELARFGMEHGGYTPEGRLIDAYAALVHHPDPRVRQEACRHWMAWENAHIALGNPAPRDARFEDPAFAQNFFTLVVHYWSHNGFCEPPLLARVDRVAHIPAVLIHGRRDVSGPVMTPFELAKRWPAAQLHIVEQEGHGGEEMVGLWCDALDAFAGELG